MYNEHVESFYMWLHTELMRGSANAIVLLWWVYSSIRLTLRYVECDKPSSWFRVVLLVHCFIGSEIIITVCWRNQRDVSIVFITFFFFSRIAGLVGGTETIYDVRRVYLRLSNAWEQRFGGNSILSELNWIRASGMSMSNFEYSGWEMANESRYDTQHKDAKMTWRA